MSTYDKPFKSLEEQIKILAERGMLIEDKEHARDFLRSIGYYKFSGYAYPFREIGEIVSNKKVIRSQEFISNLTFEHVVNLFEFDRKLAQLISEGLSAFELKLRTAFALILGESDSLAHINFKSLNPSIRHRKHVEWLNFYYRDIQKSKDKDFVVHFDEKYQGELPIWVAIEIMQFGTLAYFFDLLRDQDKVKIAAYFGVSSKELFRNIIESFRKLRNECSHLSRIWNTAHQPSFNKISHHWPSASHLFHLDYVPKTKLYPKLVMLMELSKETGSKLDFSQRILELLLNFPPVPILSLEADMGFPENWKELQFWKDIS